MVYRTILRGLRVNRIFLASRVSISHKFVCERLVACFWQTAREFFALLHVILHVVLQGLYTLDDIQETCGVPR